MGDLYSLIPELIGTGSIAGLLFWLLHNQTKEFGGNLKSLSKTISEDLVPTFNTLQEKITHILNDHTTIKKKIDDIVNKQEAEFRRQETEFRRVQDDLKDLTNAIIMIRRGNGK